MCESAVKGGEWSELSVERQRLSCPTTHTRPRQHFFGPPPGAQEDGRAYVAQEDSQEAVLSAQDHERDERE